MSYSYSKNIFCGSEYIEKSSLPNDTHNGLQKTNKVAKAYINPRIVNYELIKRSLGQDSFQKVPKIHINPNFKRNEFRIPAHNSGQSCLNQEVPNISIDKVYSADTSSRNNCTDEHRLNNLSSNKTKNYATNNKKVASQLKIINKPIVKSIYCDNYSKYSWSREKCMSRSSTAPNTKFVAEKLVKKVLPLSQYKYTARKKPVDTSESSSSCCNINPPLFKSRTKIINCQKVKSNNKFAVVVSNRCSLSNKSNIQSKFSNSPNSKALIRMASLVRSKYKYTRMSNLKQSKYKLDKRKKISMNSRKLYSTNKIKGIQKLFPKSVNSTTKFFYGDVYAKMKFLGSPSPRSLSWRKDQINSKVISKQRNLHPNRTIVKIGGILYKSTINKLTIADNTNNESKKTKKLHTTKRKEGKSHIVYVRGQKFLLDRNGKTLTRQNISKNQNFVPFKRIDLGGITYVQKSSNQLIRTNIHQARHLVNQAKQKSIATLCKLRKRSAMPCMIYHRFGKCQRHKNGVCIYNHDPKNIAICKNFLKGSCKDLNCLLSHEIIQEKMATCHFFLSGICNRENCPFLHVKVNEKATVCEQFLHGFCSLGSNCSKKHVNQCPEYHKHGNCNQGVKCLYPHNIKRTAKIVNKIKQKSNLNKEVSKANSNKALIKRKTGKSSGKRPILKVKDDENKKQQGEGAGIEENCQSPSDHSSEKSEFFPKRVKLDELPTFIPLSKKFKDRVLFEDFNRYFSNVSTVFASMSTFSELQTTRTLNLNSKNRKSDNTKSR